MTNRDDPVFLPETNNYEGSEKASGLTKREYFAAMAMQGLCSQELYASSIDDGKNDIPQKAVEYADAIIKELNKAK